MNSHYLEKHQFLFLTAFYSNGYYNNHHREPIHQKNHQYIVLNYFHPC